MESVACSWSETGRHARDGPSRGPDIAAAYPARAADAVASLTADRPWPGAALLWANVELGHARILDGPPRGVTVGR